MGIEGVLEMKGSGGDEVRMSDADAQDFMDGFA